MQWWHEECTGRMLEGIGENREALQPTMEPEMPRKNDLPSFGPEFEQLLLRAYDHLKAGNDEFSVDFASQTLAHNVKFRCYDYFKALRESTLRPDLVGCCTNLSMRTVGTSLHFYRKGDDAASAAIRAALSLPKDFADGPTRADILTAPTALDKNLERLAEVRASKPPK
jgi:hypothetical protein